MMNVQRKKHPVTSEEIVSDLLQKIEELQYMPGELISEGDLCSRYETTRHTVRGALAVLKEKGFVDVFPQRGTFISLIDLEFIDDILFLREAVEQEAVHRIIEKGKSAQLVKKLRAEIKKQKALAETRADTADFYKLDDQFHAIMLQAAGRPGVAALYADAYIHVRRWRNLEVSTFHRILDLPEEHEAIVAAIEKADIRAAREIMSHHIDSVSRYGKEMKTKYPDYFI